MRSTAAKVDSLQRPTAPPIDDPLPSWARKGVRVSILYDSTRYSGTIVKIIGDVSPEAIRIHYDEGGTEEAIDLEELSEREMIKLLLADDPKRAVERQALVALEGSGGERAKAAPTQPWSRSSSSASASAEDAASTKQDSKYAGVVWSRRDSLWLATVRQLGAPKNVGKFDSQIAAALAQGEYINILYFSMNLTRLCTYFSCIFCFRHVRAYPRSAQRECAQFPRVRRRCGG